MTRHANSRSYQSARLYVGVDGGATKTEVALGDQHGRTIRLVRGGPSSISAVGLTVSVRTVRTLVKRVLRGHDRSRLERIVLALASLDTPTSIRRVRPSFAAALHVHGQQLLLVNDVVAAYASGTDRRIGAAIIAGTGSHAYARGPHGVRHASGFGHLLADEGSGYEQGMRAIRAAVKAFDGRGPATRLTGMVLRAFGVRSIRELADARSRLIDKRTIAALAPEVERIANVGDHTAQTILRETAIEAAEAIIATLRRASVRGLVPVVEVGGLFRAPRFRRPFESAVRRAFPRADCVRPTLTPAEGALRIARTPRLFV